MLLVCLEIIATTYRSMIFKTYAFSLYSHLFIYVSIQLPFYTQYIWTGSARWLRAIGGGPEDDDRVNSEIHSEAVIKWVWRFNWRPRLNELRDALRGGDRASLEFHFEAVIVRVWRCTWRPRWGELRHALGGRNRASLDVHLEAKIEWAPRCTPSCDRASSEMHLQQAMIEGDYRSTWRGSIQRWSMGGALGAETLVIG